VLRSRPAPMSRQAGPNKSAALEKLPEEAAFPVRRSHRDPSSGDGARRHTQMCDP